MKLPFRKLLNTMSNSRKFMTKFDLPDPFGYLQVLGFKVVKFYHFERD
jgi:hypothetical protein